MPRSRRRGTGSFAALPRKRETGDVVLVMGARDPSLTAFARALLAGLKAGAGEA